MRVCSKCKRKLKESEFNWKIKNLKRSYHCKECSRSYIRKHYKNNIDYYVKKAKRRNNKIREQAISYISNYLKSHQCVDCGEKDIVVLEFDHRLRESKKYNVSRIISATSSIELLEREINKCDVRCANCHRRKTAKENNSWKLKYNK